MFEPGMRAAGPAATVTPAKRLCLPRLSLEGMIRRPMATVARLSGGGGYKVATRLLGARAGLLSGATLLVDYALTIAISVASGADAVFSLLPVGPLGFTSIAAGAPACADGP